MADSAHGAMAVMRQLAENPNLLNAVQGILTIAQSLQNSPAESDNSAARPSAHVAAPSTTRKTSQRRLRNNNNSNSDDVEDDWLDERSQAARRRQRREGVQMHGGDEALFSAPRRAQRGASNSLSTHGSPAPFTTTTLTSSRPAQHIAHEANNLVSRAEMDRQISALTQMLQQKEEEVHQLRTEAQREVEDVRRSFEATIQRKEEEHLHAMKELLRTNQLTITAERFQATIDGARQKQQQQQQQQQYSPMLARRDGSSTTAPALPSSLARYARNDDVEVKMGEVKPEQQRSRSRVVCVKTEDEELYNTPIYGADVVGDDVAGKKMATRVRRAPRTPSHTNADRTRKAQPTNTPTTTTTTTAAHASPAQAAVPITVTRVRTNNNNNNHVGGLWSGASSVANGRTRSPSPVNPKRGIDGPRRFIFTALSDEAEVAELANTIERIGLDAAVLRCGFDEPPPTETTHIVTRGTPRSVKALCGVVAGKWLVPPEYIFNSLRAGFWLDEMEEGGLRVFPTRLRFQRVLLTARDAAIREKLAQVIQYGGGNIIYNSSSQGDGRGRQGDESVVVISSGEDLLRFATQRADA